MAYKKIIKDHAKDLYLQGRTIPEVTKILDIPERTIMRWKKKYKWEDSEKSVSPLALVYQLQEAFNNKLQEALNDDTLGNPAVADSLVKLAKIMDRTIPKKIMLANILNMLTDVTAYFRNHVEDDAFIDQFSRYIPEIADFLKNKYTAI